MITVNVKCFSQVMYALDTDILLLELELGTTTDIFHPPLLSLSFFPFSFFILLTSFNQKYIPYLLELKDGD